MEEKRAMVLVRGFEFEGQPLPVYEVEGRPHWIAKQVGAALGYSRDGSKLTTKIGGDWKKSFNGGEDFRVLTGKDLSDFKGLVGVSPESGASHTPSLMLLSEKGLYKVLMMTRKGAGDRMRDWLAADVLPQIARDGHFAPDRWVVDGKMASRADLEPVRVETQRLLAEAKAMQGKAAIIRAESRAEFMRDNVAIKEKKAQMLERRDKCRAHALAGRAKLAAGLISLTEFAAYMVHAAEIVVGGRIESMRGNDPHGPWLRARDLSRMWNIHEQTIGRAAKFLGFHANIPGMSREVVARRENSGGSVPTYEYSVKAQAEIKAHLDLVRSRQVPLDFDKKGKA